MSLAKNIQGKRGEDLAVSYLQKNGYQVIDRNFRIRGGEIDIIAIDKDTSGQKTLVFIEVKTRSSNDYGTPLEAIGYFKLKSLIKTAQFYKASHRLLPELLRIDAIAVSINAQEQLLDIELVKNIS